MAIDNAIVFSYAPEYCSRSKAALINDVSYENCTEIFLNDMMATRIHNKYRGTK